MVVLVEVEADEAVLSDDDVDEEVDGEEVEVEVGASVCDGGGLRLGGAVEDD